MTGKFLRAESEKRTLTTWHIITGEYPPNPGGVADYTQLVALGLAAHGDSVHVWAPRGSNGPRRTGRGRRRGPSSARWIRPHARSTRARARTDATLVRDRY